MIIGDEVDFSGSYMSSTSVIHSQHSNMNRTYHRVMTTAYWHLAYKDHCREKLKKMDFQEATGWAIQI